MEIVFGVISPKINKSTVAARVAIPTPFSPKISSATAVKIEERRIFTKSFETKSEFIKCSFLSKSFPAVCARLFLFFLRILSLSLFIPKKALSEIEKSIERTIKITRIIISTYEGYSSIF